MPQGITPLRLSPQRPASLRAALQRYVTQRNATNDLQEVDMPLIFEASANSRLLYQVLVKSVVGDFISYAALSEAVSCKVEASFGALTTARRRAMRHDRMLFGVVIGVGLKRLADVEIVAQSSSDTRKLRRHARRSAERLTKVEHFDKMPPSAQLEHTARLSIFLAVTDMASERTVKKVEAAAGGRASELPIAETLRAFLA